MLSPQGRGSEGGQTWFSAGYFENTASRFPCGLHWVEREKEAPRTTPRVSARPGGTMNHMGRREERVQGGQVRMVVEDAESV